MEKEKDLERILQVGTVTAVDGGKRKARVKFQDTGITSDWLFVVQHYGAGVAVHADGEHTHDITDTFSGGGTASTEPAHNHKGSSVTTWMPKVNDRVLVAFLPVENGDGFVIGGL